MVGGHCRTCELDCQPWGAHRRGSGGGGEERGSGCDWLSWRWGTMPTVYSLLRFCSRKLLCEEENSGRKKRRERKEMKKGRKKRKGKNGKIFKTWKFLEKIKIIYEVGQRLFL
jgi:hypothetical protein